MTSKIDENKELLALIDVLKESCHAKEVHAIRPTAPERNKLQIDIYKNVLVYPESHGGHFIYELDTGTFLCIEGVFRIIMHDKPIIFHLKLLKRATTVREANVDDTMVG